MRKIKSVLAVSFALISLGAGSACFADRLPPKVIPQTPAELKAELKQIQSEIALKPHDAQLQFKLAECYRKMAMPTQASQHYAKAGNLDPTMYVAFHQLALHSTDNVQLDEAIEKLTKLSNEKPKELLLRVALSELLEKRGNYYQAARTLIDLSYANAVPEKYRTKVASRIHNMLALAKSQKGQVVETPTANLPNTDEELDLVPAPLPTPSTKRSIAQARLKDSKEVRGMGHTPLIP